MVGSLGDSKPAGAMPGIDLFPSSHVGIPSLPYLVSYGVSGWLDGRPIVCGGADVSTRKYVKSCYSLDRTKGWMIDNPMIQERFAASSAIIELSGRPAMWVLGGTNAHDKGLSSSSILSQGAWIPGPPMTGVRAGQCSLSISPTSVLVTGGLTKHGSTTLVETFSFRKLGWTTMPSLNYKRERHACTQVWIAADGTVVKDPGPKDVMAIVVAGGDAYEDASEHSVPVTSVEMFVQNSWTMLPSLPNLELGKMSRPTALHWIPDQGLMLLGGCWINLDTNDQDRKSRETKQACTNKIWKLEGGTNNYTWILQNETLGAPLMIGNSDMLLPSNYFSSTSNQPRAGLHPF